MNNSGMDSDSADLLLKLSDSRTASPFEPPAINCLPHLASHDASLYFPERVALTSCFYSFLHPSLECRLPQLSVHSGLIIRTTALETASAPTPTHSNIHLYQTFY